MIKSNCELNDEGQQVKCGRIISYTQGTLSNNPRKYHCVLSFIAVDTPTIKLFDITDFKLIVFRKYMHK